MTDVAPTPPNDPPDPPAREPTPGARRARSPYRVERAIVATVFFAMTVPLAVHGAWVIHRDTFRTPAPSHAIESCRREVDRLFQRYAVLLSPYRSDPRVGWRPQRPSQPHVRAELARLDEDLMAARPFCIREGAEAQRAHTSLTLWRHLAEDHARLGENLVTGHAERALSGSEPTNASGNTP